MKRTVLSLIVLTALVVSAPAFAATATANLSVTATVGAVCTITTTAVAFGAYDPVSANRSTDLAGTGAVNVACTKGASATIDLGNGSNFASGTRKMSNGTDTLSYALYKNTLRTQVWGTGLAGGTTAAYTAADYNVTAITVYGTVPQAQNVSVGSYSDTVVATITY